MDALTAVDPQLIRQTTSDMLVESVADRLARFVRPAQLRREIEQIISNLRGKETKLKQEAFDELLGKANELITQQSGEKPQTIALKQISFLKSVIADDEVDIRAQLSANLQLTDLIGTSAKHRSEFFEPRDIATMTRKMVAEMDELIEQEDAMNS